MMSLLEIGWPPARYTSTVPFGIGVGEEGERGWSEGRGGQQKYEST